MEQAIVQEDVTSRVGTSFSRYKNEHVPCIVLEEVKKTPAYQMCKVQVLLRQKYTDRPFCLM